MLIVAGDIGENHDDYFLFFTWIAKTDYQKKVVIAGNHDYLIENGEVPIHACADFDYLCDSGTEFQGLKIWGTPWVRVDINWHPNVRAFGKYADEQLEPVWETIPKDTNILVTHSPPHGIGDCVGKTFSKMDCVGSPSLRNQIQTFLPKLHVYGHIHEGYGMRCNSDFPNIRFVNAAIMDKYYDPVNEPITIEL